MQWLQEIYNKQKLRQQRLTNSDCNTKNYTEVYHSATAAMVEIGEMLQADTRWKENITKSKKQPVINEEMFLEEWADAFIYMLNVLIYYNASITDIKYAIENKMHINEVRFNEDKQQ